MIIFDYPLNTDMQLGLMSEVYQTKGNMAWEYNPFRNYRLTESKYYFRNKFFSKSELIAELTNEENEEHWMDVLETQKNWDWARVPKEDENKIAPKNGIQSYEDDPVFYDAGQLVDFDTDELSFSLNHPVDVLPQYSYDGSVNLILNDGLNPPKLINSRFSALGKQKYEIVDRRGDNDTNIYDAGNQFQTDTSLYKSYSGIPRISFINTYYGGSLPVGNYHFYFKYMDADGNETDFVGESGLVSVFKGSTFGNISSGFREENSQKQVKFIIENVDPAYQYIVVYYTKSSSDINQNPVTTAYKIDQKFLVNNSLVCSIQITGNEPTISYSLDFLNLSYYIAKNVKTQEQVQNMLFFGNITDYNLDYEELADLSLRFVAKPDVSKGYSPTNYNYSTSVSNTYADPRFIYNYTGYQNHEIYRFGVVYLMSNGQLSPVFNIRGGYFNSINDNYSKFEIYKDNDRNYITYNENTGIIYQDQSQEESDTSKINSTISLENVFGVVRIESGEDQEINQVIGIRIELDYQDSKLFEELQKYDIKGYFFVRQKRMPLRLCQAFTVGIDQLSHIPMPYVDKEDSGFLYERFFNNDRVITHQYDSRIQLINSVSNYGAICPEYDVNYPYYNSLFCGEQYVIEQASPQIKLKQDTFTERNWYADPNEYTRPPQTNINLSNVIGIEDNVKLVETGGKLFSARAGEAEEGHRYEYIQFENKVSEATNIIRESFGPYIGLSSYTQAGTLINIYLQDYQSMSSDELFQLRINDKSAYYAISDRFDIQASFNNPVLYRGDTYICTFTHRLNRNFQDPSAPTNDKIVDPNCWKDNYNVEDEVVNMEDFANVNLGDLNAVKIGTWITFTLVSSTNLNIRSLDDSIPDEIASNGHPRGFYPYYGLTADGTHKTPEALCYNSGFDKSLSERYNFELPNVPAFKSNFNTRIAYSDIHVNDAFKNGFRTFQSNHYRDYPKAYGQITKLIEWNGSLLCVFEHGVALIPVNERAVAGEGAGGNVFINTSNVLPQNPLMLSTLYGSQWKESIIKTKKAIYGVDTVAKKIWRTNGQDFMCISDFKIGEFLNNNISLTERELDPIIGIRNVKSHFNEYKQDLMFTFYDNLYGFEEKVWNICWNELTDRWVTFYSWVPSYSENIYNSYFSFDRNTSKWIAKLGTSHDGNDFADGVVLNENIIPNDAKKDSIVGTLNLVSRDLPTGDGIDVVVTYELERDNYQNYKNFEIVNIVELTDNQKNNTYTTINKEAFPNWDIYFDEVNDKGKNVYKFKETVDLNNVPNYDVEQISNVIGEFPPTKSQLKLKTDAVNLCSELFIRGLIDGEELTDPGSAESKKDWINNCVLSAKYSILKDDRGRRRNLDQDKKINPDKLVTLLNIKANLKTIDNSNTPSLSEALTTGFTNGTIVDAGYYESVVAVMPQYNMQFLTTDFWKHGQAGIIDIADKVYPTYWYGKQHPFEFEFVVNTQQTFHKIFDNLEIISNNAEPESFHYEIVGDCYDFAKDKKNMYIRQEATKEFYQYNGSDITYDHDYTDLTEVHRDINGKEPDDNTTVFDKSTILPLYYSRQDTINEIEDYYHNMSAPSKDYSALAGGEIVYYKNLDEYRIWNHAKGVNVQTAEQGRLRGNMQYNEDKWVVQIDPINVVQKNEPAWNSVDLFGRNEPDTLESETLDNKIPIEIGQSPIPDDIITEDKITGEQKTITTDDLPDKHRAVVAWDWNDSQNQEVKVKDKWIKIRIRYTGDKLAIISAVRTLFSLSYA